MNLYLITDGEGCYYCHEERSFSEDLADAMTWETEVAAKLMLERLKKKHHFFALSLQEMSEEEFRSKTSLVGQKFTFVEFQDYPHYQVQPVRKEEVAVVHDNGAQITLSNKVILVKRKAFNYSSTHLLLKEPDCFDYIINLRKRESALRRINQFMDAHKVAFWDEVDKLLIKHGIGHPRV